MNSNVPKIVSRIAATSFLMAIAFIVLPSFWSWVSFETVAVSLVAIGCSGEWYLHHHPAGRKRQEKDDHHKLESRFIGAVALGVTMELFALGHSIREGLKLENKVAQLTSANLALQKQIEDARPENRPITSISAIATFRIKGDFSPPPMPYPDLGEMSGASIMFLQGTNISDSVPNLGIGAEAADISIFNLIPNNEHPDTHDVVIKFHDAGDVMSGHFFNKWMWRNKAGFFDHVKGLVISMRQIGSNVNVLSGNVVVTANDLKWEFPIPPQRQRLGTISSKVIKNAKGQDEVEVMPVDLMDCTSWACLEKTDTEVLLFIS